MARGILTGIATGVVVAGLGLGTASLVLGPVEMEPVAPVPRSVEDAPEPGATPTPDDAAGAPEAEADAVEDAGQAPVEPSPDTAPQAPDTEPAPDTEDAPAIGTSAAAPDEAERDAMAVPDAPATTPEAGETAEPDEGSGDEADTASAIDDDTVSDDPVPESEATAPAPEVAPEDTAPEPLAPSAPEPDPRATTGMDLPDGAPEILPPEDEPLPTDGGDPAPGADLTAPAPGEDETPEPDRAPAEEASEIGPEADPSPSMAETSAPEADAPDAPETAPAPETGATAPDATAAPEEPAEVVVTGRLPSIGEAPEAETPAAAPVPALIRNAIDFAGSGDQPLLAILLLDTGGDRAPVGDLGNLPFPVTVAVDAGATDADEAIAFYRDQGAEIMLVVPLPEGATAMDVDVSVEAYGPLLEDAAAVLVADDLGFQTLGDGAVQLGVNLAESGHGFVSYPAGLNTGHKAVLKEGVNAGLVFRDLDGAGQEGPVIRRFLDNAAFRARNEERVIVVARTRAETVQALLEWSLGTRAQTVTLAPISAVLEGG